MADIVTVSLSNVAQDKITALENALGGSQEWFIEDYLEKHLVDLIAQYEAGKARKDTLKNHKTFKFKP